MNKIDQIEAAYKAAGGQLPPASQTTKDLLMACTDEMRQVIIRKSELCDDLLQQAVFAKCIGPAFAADLSLAVFYEAHRRGLNVEAYAVNMTMQYAEAFSHAAGLAKGAKV